MLLALVVVVTQLGAQAHAYSHVSSHHTATSPQHGLPVKCTDCVAFSPLLATAGGSFFPDLHLPTPVVSTIAAFNATFPRLVTLTAYRSRAPPPRP